MGRKLWTGLYAACTITFIFLISQTFHYSYISVKTSTPATNTLNKNHWAFMHSYQPYNEKPQRLENPPKNSSGKVTKKENLSAHLEYTHDARGQKILLFTSYRSGSSFVGEILKRQQSTFYTFEPFNFLQFQSRMSPYLTERLLGSNVSHYMSSLFRCNFQPLKMDSMKYFPQEHGLRNTWIPRCFNGARSFEEAEAKCKQRDNNVAKVIRVKYIKDILKLIDENVIIVHLIRDPRGTLASRMKLSYASMEIKLADTRLKAKTHCSKLRDNWEYITKLVQLPDTLLIKKISQRYLLIRYEDFAYHPENMAKRLTEVIRTSPPDDFYQWLKRITSHDDSNPYGTFRQSNITAEGWRKYLPYKVVKVIQEACEDVLGFYGYTLVTSEDELSDTTKSFVSELPKHLPQL